MSVQDKISKKFRGIQGGLFEKVSKADVGTALNDLIANGAALMCWGRPLLSRPGDPGAREKGLLWRGWRTGHPPITPCPSAIWS